MAEASAPASSANLGPGFDCLAVALDLRCRVMAVPAPAWTVEHLRPDAPAPADDAVLAAARLAVGDRHPLALHVDSAIPLGRGLGSSAAARAAGAAAAWRAVDGEVDPDRVFRLVADMEDHADNAAAAVYGGLVLVGPGGIPHRLPFPAGLGVIVMVPDRPLATAEARLAVPERVGRDVAVRTLARTAALVAGLLTDDGAALLADAAGDELHEAPRSGLRPEIAGMIDAARRHGALHAAWSGAGPSVLALAPAGEAAAIAAALRDELPPATAVLTPSVADRGLC